MRDLRRSAVWDGIKLFWVIHSNVLCLNKIFSKAKHFSISRRGHHQSYEENCYKTGSVNKFHRAAAQPLGSELTGNSVMTWASSAELTLRQSYKLCEEIGIWHCILQYLQCEKIGENTYTSLLFSICPFFTYIQFYYMWTEKFMKSHYVYQRFLSLNHH